MYFKKARLLKRAFLFFSGAIVFMSHSLLATPSSISRRNFYDVLSPGESLKNNLRFVVIDDFNDGKFDTRADKSGWSIKQTPQSKAGFKTNKQDGRNAKRGHALEISLDLKPFQTIDLKKNLNHIDVSQAKYFLFRSKVSLKKNLLPTGRIILSFVDRSQKRHELDITSQMDGNRNQWTTIALPMKAFRELDLDQLLTVTLRFRSGKGAMTGKINLDEIAFFGEGNVNFESSRDNIYGFPEKVFSPERRQQLLTEKKDEPFLYDIARDTWAYFEKAKNRKTQLIVDNIKVGEGALVSGYTSPTNIAMDLLAISSAETLGFISRDHAVHQIKAVLSSLTQMKRHKGFFFNFYETKNLMVTRSYISSVDNGWLALSFVVLRQTYREVAEPLTQILKEMNFNEFFDTENNQLVIGYDVPDGEFGGNHYGMLVSEARAMSAMAIGKGDIPEDHWWFLYRTPPAAWKWQRQTPKGKFVTQDGNELFEGYYEKNGKKFVPSWGGSLFEYLMPTLILNEKDFSPKGLGLNDRIASELQRDYALQEKKYPVWGISPAASVNGKSWQYQELGVPDLGVKGYPDRGVITPHVSFLALETIPEDAIKNLRALLEFNMYGEYGFYDTLNLKNREVNTQYLALDQGMTLVALCNYLKKGAIKQRFHEDPIGQKVRELLKKESFF